ncbi:hypothetical protein LINPERHAP1_LOCUS23918 [Linum perenne]
MTDKPLITTVPSGDSSTTTQTTMTLNPSSDSFPGQAAIYKLDGSNYMHWSQSVLIFITGRGKAGYLHGTKEKPAKTDPTFEQWDIEDNLVRGWLLSTMHQKIGENYLLHPSAKSIWDHAKKTYSTVDNSSALLEIETKLFNLKQGNMSVNDYYNTLNRHWMQLDLYEVQDWTSTADAEIFRKFVEKKRTLHFLLGLNQELDAAKGRVMATKPFPDLETAVSDIRREESRQHVMLTDVKATAEGSALKTSTPMNAALSNKSSNPRQIDKPGDNEMFYCEHCKKPWHTKAQCWELNGGKPANWKSRSERLAEKRSQNSRANAASSTTSGEDNHFSKGQVDSLKKMLAEALRSGQNSNSPADFFSGSFAQGGGIGEDDWSW